MKEKQEDLFFFSQFVFIGYHNILSAIAFLVMNGDIIRRGQ
jgi:hypothetical protein